MHSDPRRFGHLCLYRTLQIHLFAYGTLYFLYPLLLVFVFLFLLHNHQPGNISMDRIDPKHAHESYSRLVMQPVLLQQHKTKLYKYPLFLAFQWLETTNWFPNEIILFPVKFDPVTFLLLVPARRLAGHGANIDFKLFLVPNRCRVNPRSRKPSIQLYCTFMI